MKQTPTTIVDLARLSLAHGEGRRLDLPVRIDPMDLGGQTYAATQETVPIRLDISRPSGGYAFHLRFPVQIEGPCMRCLEPASIETDVDAREVDQHNTEDEELLSPYVQDDELDLGRWTHDAALLAIPIQFLCRPDCAGLCPVCGASLNDTDPSTHEHGQAQDPRWSKLKDLKVE